jgi:hypothetical protein
MKQAGSLLPASCWLHPIFLLGLLFDLEDHMAFNGLHGIISQKTELFITTAVEISDPIVLHILSRF